MNKKTFLYEEQLKLKAKMVPFAGWEMPVQYEGIFAEHFCVRNDVGLFDVSHMGEFFVKGVDSLAFLQKIVPQDISKLDDSKAVYCQLTNEKAGIIDDLIIYKLKLNEYLLIVNASRIEEDFDWIVKNKAGFDVDVENQSDNYSLLAVQGPKASDLMEVLGLEKDKQPSFFSIKEAEIDGVDLFVSRTGYTGEDGFELLFKNEYAVKLWNLLLEKGSSFNIKPIGLGARDSLRLEAALHLYGNDMNENTTPIEVGLSWSIPKNKCEDYNGKKVILEQLAKGCNKQLVALKMLEKKAIARHGYEIYNNGNKVGEVTSGGISPTLSENIALGLLTGEKVNIGESIYVMIRGKLHEAKVVKKPFVAKKNKIT